MEAHETADLTRRLRFGLLGLALLAQAVMFLVLMPRPPLVENDNTRYETAGAMLAAGRGLVLPFADLGDPDLREWACSRHPERCDGEYYPSASYPPGYQFFIGALYTVTGRSLAWLMAAHFVLLMLMVVFVEDLSRRLLPRDGHIFVMLVVCVYPFIARQAGRVMSDHLHAALLLAGVWALVVLKPGVRRGVLAGLLLSAATLTRPYSLVCFGAFLLPSVRARLRLSMGEFLAVGGAAAVLFGAWATRNAVTFGKFIPLTASGLGAALYLNKLEWTVGSSLDGDNARVILAELQRVAGGDFNTWGGNKALQKEAIGWMLENPGRVVLALIPRLPRVWVSMGFQGGGISKAALLIVPYLGGLLVLGLVGMWRRRKADGPWTFMSLVVLSYWAFLMHTPAEARRSLPLRWILLLFAGAAVSDALSWWRARKMASRPSPSTESTGR